MACAQGMLTAPGMCPVRCAPSVAFSGGAAISPLYSAGERTSTRRKSSLPRIWRTSGNMTELVCAARVVVHLEDADLGIVQVVLGPGCGGEDLGMRVVGHGRCPPNGPGDQRKTRP